jgi:hypothetical protein
MRQVKSVVANHPSGFFTLAAAPRQPLDAMPTSPRKTRVRGFRRHASGQTSSRRRCRSINTPGSRGCAYKTVSGRHEWPNRDPLGEAGGINLYSYVGNDPMDFLDPYGLVRWGGVFSATAGIIGNSFGLAGGFALGIGTSWTGVGAVAGGVIAVKSGYGVGANILNLIDAINDREDSNKGSLLNDLAAKAAPCNKDAQKLATALDLAIDLGGSRIAKAAQTVSMADQYGNVVLEGGATLGPTFSESADASIEVLGGVQAGQTILETAFPNIFGEDGQ